MKELNDNETGLYYLKSRYYNPELGRFVSADAVVGKTGEILSHNLFSYCANNPVNAIDEDGNRFEWIKSKWNSFKKAVVTGVRKVVAGVKRIAARVVSGVKKAVRAASTWVRNKYRGYTNTARNTYRRTKKWVHNTARTISQKVRNTAHSVVKHTRSFVKNHRRAIEITRNVVAIASIALIAIPLVAPVAIPAMAIAALGIVEVGLDLAVGDNTSAAVGLLFLFPMSKGFKYVTEIGGDAIKGGSKAKNLYKAEGLLKMDLQKFGVNLYKSIDRSSPASYYTYSELKSLIKKAGLSGRTKGFEAHHLLEKQFADVFKVAKNDIISVPLTPKWHRNVGGMGNNLDNLISEELDLILTKVNKSSAGKNEVWQAHRNVYEKIGQSDWANAVYEEYVKKFNIPYK